MRAKRSVVASFALLASCSAAIAQEPAVPTGQTYVPAQLIERTPPTYPVNALYSAKEGWVMLSFVISPTGEVTEPMIEDSSGVEAFERAALRAVQRWKYTPAMQDGEPVEQAMTKTQIRFQLEGGPAGASWAFVNKYRRIARLIDAGDLEAAGELIKELEYGERTNLYEDAWFWWAKYVYLAKAGSTDADEMRRCLQRAVGYEEEYLRPDLFVSAAERLVVLQAQALDIAAAIAAFERLRDAKTARRSDNYEAVVANLEPGYERMLEFVEGGQLLMTKARIGQFEYWVHDLLRRSFSVADIAGRLDALDIRCARGTKRYSDVPVGVVWTIPESWGTCGVYMKGEPGATFTFHEYPRSFVPEVSDGGAGGEAGSP